MKQVKYVMFHVPASIILGEDMEDTIDDVYGERVFLYDDSIKIIVNFESGKVVNWRGGVEYINYKVIDSGKYYLLDEDMETIATWGDGYVPHNDLLNGRGWGDYLDMEFDSTGSILFWKPKIGDGWIWND